MTSTHTVRCARPTCRRVTSDPSGRCHDHRSSTPLPPGVELAPTSAPALVLDAPTEQIVDLLLSFGGKKVEGRCSTWTTDAGIHRLDGPAIRYTHVSDGTEISAAFYVCGKQVEGFSGVASELRRLPPRIRRAEIASSYGVLLDEGVAADTVVEVLDNGVTTVEGIRALVGGAPLEWVQAFEEGRA